MTLTAVNDDIAQMHLPGIPKNWEVIKDHPCGWMIRRIELTVMASVAMYGEELDLYLHLSFSRQRRDPTYQDMALVRKLFVKPDQKALMIFPALTDHVNIHAHCLHFYVPIDTDPLPEFSTGGMI